MLNTHLITNSKVRNAIEALQSADAATWFSHFEPDTQLLDDGHPADFRSFFEHALGHEHFTIIDQVENDGKAVFGQFHSDQWGNFKTYFKFHLNAAARFDKLEIGQAEY